MQIHVIATTAVVLLAMTRIIGVGAIRDRDATTTAVTADPATNRAASKRTTVEADLHAAAMMKTIIGAPEAAMMRPMTIARLAVEGGTAIPKATVRLPDAEGMITRPGDPEVATITKGGIALESATRTMARAVGAAGGLVTGRVTQKLLGKAGTNAVHPGRVVPTTTMMGVVAPALATTRAVADGLATPEAMPKRHVGVGRSVHPVLAAGRTRMMIAEVPVDAMTKATAVGTGIRGGMPRPRAVVGKIATANYR